jgi:hypothetical protein
MSSSPTASSVISSVVLVSILWGILLIYFIASFAGAAVFNDIKTVFMIIMLVIIAVISLLS